VKIEAVVAAADAQNQSASATAVEHTAAPPARSAAVVVV
jgi:hypothetical protein